MSNRLQRDYKKYDRSFSGAEDQFFRDSINLQELALSEGWEFDKKESSQMTKIYRRNGHKITINKVGLRYLWSYVGQENAPKGSVVEFIKTFNQLEGKQLYAHLRDVAQRTVGVEYSIFKDRFLNENKLPLKEQNQPIKPIEQVNIQVPEEVEEDIEEGEAQKIFILPQLENIDFLLNRGLIEPTINHPLFKGRLGSTQAEFGVEAGEKTPFKNTDFQFEHHLLVPSWNRKGELVGLEAKNKYKDEVYNHEVNKAVDRGDSISSVRKNPSRYYPQSSKSALWSSNIIGKPKAILISEQPIDALSYFQVNQPKDTLFVSTGGNFTDNQLIHFKALIKEHGIEQVITGFDNDINGLRYSLKVLSAFKEKKGEIDLSFSTYLKDEIVCEIKTKSGKPTAQRLKNRQAEFEKLFNSVPWDGRIESYPGLFISDSIIKFSIPYSRNNSEQLIKLSSRLWEVQEGRFKFHSPGKSKDWNDELNNSPAISFTDSVYLYDHKQNRNRILLDRNLNIIFQRRLFSVDQNIKENAGRINPFGPHPIDLNNTLLPTPELSTELQRLTSLYHKYVPALNNNFIKQALTGDIAYYELDSTFQNKKGVIATYKDGGLIKVSPDITNTERLILERMAWNLAQGRAFNQVEWDLRNNKLSVGNLNNQGLYYNESYQFFTLSEKVGSVQNGLFQSPQDLSVKSKEIIQQLIANPQYQQPESSEGYFKISARGDVYRSKIIATWKGNRIELNDPNEAGIQDEQFDILERMQNQLLAGSNPNYPNLRATLKPDFSLDILKEFSKEGSFSISEQRELQLINTALNNAQEGFIKFREIYPEPLLPIKAENSIFYYNAAPIYRYNQENGMLEFLGRDKDLVGRSFPMEFYKALELFTENQGSFENIMRLTKVDRQSRLVYYNEMDFGLGTVFKATNGKYFLAPFDDISPTFINELKRLSPLPVADAALIKENGIDTKRGLNARLKEQKVSYVPQKFRTFFNKDGKFVPMPEDKIRDKKQGWRELYTQALLWNLENNKTESNQRKYVIREKNGEVFMNTFHFATYNEKDDKLHINIQIDQRFYPQLALIEKQLVKTPANRAFSQYLQGTQPVETTTNRSKVIELLTKIDKDTQTNNLLIRDPITLKSRIFAHESGNDLHIDSAYHTISQVFKSAMELYAKERKLQIKWEDKYEQTQAQTTEIKAEVPQLPKEKFDQSFRLTNDGLLLTLLENEVFGKSAVYEEGQTRFLFNHGPSGQLIMPYNSAYGKLEGSHTWLHAPEKAESLVITQTPDQALLLYQQTLLSPIHENSPASIHGKDLYACFINQSEGNIQKSIEALSKQYGASKITLVGNDDFLNKLEPLFKSNKNYQLKSVVSLTAKATLESLQNKLQYTEPDTLLQSALEASHGKRIFNPCKGVAIIPTESAAATHRMIIGAKSEFAQVHQGMWTSHTQQQMKALHNPRVILAANPREIIYYQKLNEEFTKGDVLVAFQGNLNQDHVSRLTKLLAAPRYEGKIFAITTDRFQHQLIDLKFPYEVATQNPGIQISFEAEYQRLHQARESVSLQIETKQKLTSRKSYHQGNDRAPNLEKEEERKRNK